MPRNPDDLTARKKALRPHALTLRRAAHLALAEEAAARVCDHLLAGRLVAGPVAVVAGYWPIGDELDVRPALRALAGCGAAIALPVVVEARRPLDFRAWTPDEPLEAGAHGTFHPRADAATLRPDLLLVPLLAFDDSGHRLGYGGGYYDRTLQVLRADRRVVAVGVAYAAQRLALVPHDDNDQMLDYIVTEQGLRRTGG
jgi:5-formyltetrahydrofolate cyclo-ligase